MKATANVLTASIPELIISHGNEQIHFSINVFNRASFSSIDHDIFSYINQYWSKLPEPVQDNIFRIYKDIYTGFNEIYVTTNLGEFLTNKVSELLNIITLESVFNFIAYESDIITPAGFNIDYKHNIDTNTSREKTYTRHDYLELISMSTIFKCMIPIWGEYINNIRKETGNEFKEFQAFQLLSKSSIINSLPMQKLQTYIDHTIEKDKANPVYTLNSISSDDASYWLLTLVCVRKISIGDIRGLNDSNIITLIYKFILQIINNPERNSEDNIKDRKNTESESGGENERSSILERTKVKSSESTEDSVLIEYISEDIIQNAIRICPEIDLNLLLRSIETSRLLSRDSVTISIPQLMLLGWVVKSIMSPRAIYSLNKIKIAEAIGAAEAILWTKNHKYLALLISSYSINEDNSILISPVDSKTKINQDLVDELERIYPSANFINKKVNRSANYAMQSIERFLKEISSLNLKPTAHPELLTEYFGNHVTRLSIVPDIKNLLANLIIELGKRTWI